MGVIADVQMKNQNKYFDWHSALFSLYVNVIIK